MPTPPLDFSLFNVSSHKSPFCTTYGWLLFIAILAYIIDITMSTGILINISL